MARQKWTKRATSVILTIRGRSDQAHGERGERLLGHRLKKTIVKNGECPIILKVFFHQESGFINLVSDF
jgi:hypothetical protein